MRLTVPQKSPAKRRVRSPNSPRSVISAVRSGCCGSSPKKICSPTPSFRPGRTSACHVGGSAASCRVSRTSTLSGQELPACRVLRAQHLRPAAAPPAKSRAGSTRVLLKTTRSFGRKEIGKLAKFCDLQLRSTPARAAGASSAWPRDRPADAAQSVRAGVGSRNRKPAPDRL